MSDLYELLGADRSMTALGIKRAYHAKAKLLHPDIGGDKAAFEVVAAAYAILGDPDKRAKYDHDGTIDDKAENDRAKALGIIQRFMEDVLGEIAEGHGEGGITNDVVETMREAVSERITKITTDIGQMEAAIERYVKFGKRFKSTQPSNVLAGMVDTKVRNIQRGVIDAGRALELHQVALEILKDHSFEFDPPAPPVPMQQTAVGFGMPGLAQQSAMGANVFYGMPNRNLPG